MMGTCYEEIRSSAKDRLPDDPKTKNRVIPDERASVSRLLQTISFTLIDKQKEGHPFISGKQISSLSSVTTHQSPPISQKI